MSAERRHSLLSILLLAAAIGPTSGCGEDLCAQAAAHYRRCTGESLPVDPQCDRGAAEDLLLMDCDAVASAYGKADSPCPVGTQCESALVALALEAPPGQVTAVSDEAPLDKLRLWVGEPLPGAPLEIALFLGDGEDDADRGEDDADRGEDDEIVPPKVDEAALVRWARVQPDDWFTFELRGSYVFQVEAIDEQDGLSATVSTLDHAAVKIAEVHDTLGEDLSRLALARLSEAGSAVSFRYRDALHLLQVEDVKRLFGWRRVVSTVARCPGSCLGESPLAADEDEPPEDPPLQFELPEEDPRCPLLSCDDDQDALAALRVTYSAVDWWGPFAEQQATLSLHGPRPDDASEKKRTDDKKEDETTEETTTEETADDKPNDEPGDGDGELSLELSHAVEGLRVTATVKICGEGAEDLAGKVKLSLMPAGQGKVIAVDKQLEAGTRVEGGCALSDLVITVEKPGDYHALATFENDARSAKSSPAKITVAAPDATPAADEKDSTKTDPEKDDKGNVWVVDITRRTVDDKVVYTVFACYQGLPADSTFEIGLYLQKKEPACGEKPDFPAWTVEAGEKKDCKRYETDPAERAPQLWARADLSCKAVEESDRDDNLKGKTFPVSDNPRDAETSGGSRDERSGAASDERPARDERRGTPQAAVAGGGCRVAEPRAGDLPLCLLLLALAPRAVRRRRP